jgi:uncharacterized protein DUF3592/PH (Pleckstrin Homology) domain-containing protein
MIVVALVIFLVTFLHWRENLDFSDRAAHTTGRIIENERYERITVRYAVGGKTFDAEAPVYDEGSYDKGETVPVIYDPRNPKRVQVVDDPYDAATPGISAILIFLGGVFVAGRAYRWVSRLGRIAMSTHETFAMTGALWRSDRLNSQPRWLSLYALDAGPMASPIVSVRLLGPPEAEETRGRFSVLVRGRIADGGVIVASAGDTVFWPADDAEGRASFHARTRIYRPDGASPVDLGRLHGIAARKGASVIRSRGSISMGLIVAAFAGLAGAGVTLALTASSPAQFSGVLAMIVGLVVTGVIGLRAWSVSLSIGQDEIEVRNLLRTRRVPWATIARVRAARMWFDAAGMVGEKANRHLVAFELKDGRRPVRAHATATIVHTRVAAYLDAIKEYAEPHGVEVVV